jgi:tyrosinase
VSYADPVKRTKDIAGPIEQFAHPFHYFDDYPETSQPVTMKTPLEFHGLIPGKVTVGDAMNTRAGKLCYTYDKL